MKKAVTVTVIIALVGAVAGAYWLGRSHGITQGVGLLRGTLVAELTALQDIRSGKTDEAVRRLESHCFSTAAGLLDDPKWRGHVSVRAFMPELVRYRSENRPTPSEWTPTERTLEGLLAREGWKRSEPPPGN